MVGLAINTVVYTNVQCILGGNCVPYECGVEMADNSTCVVALVNDAIINSRRTENLNY